MKTLLITSLITTTFLFTGCDNSRKEAAKIKAAKQIVENRKLYREDIIKATNECIESSNTLTHLTAAGNDSEEVVEACERSVQKTYGAYSPYYEYDLLEYANME